MGRAKAAVFPLPVSAKPMRSRPWRANGIASLCMGVGALYPSAVQASHNCSITPKSRKDFGAGSSRPEVGSGTSGICSATGLDSSFFRAFLACTGDSKLLLLLSSSFLFFKVDIVFD